MCRPRRGTTLGGQVGAAPLLRLAWSVPGEGEACKRPLAHLEGSDGRQTGVGWNQCGLATGAKFIYLFI